MGIEISDYHIIQQFRQIQIQEPEESSEESDEKDKRPRKYKLTIERRLYKKHFDAVF